MYSAITSVFSETFDYLFDFVGTYGWHLLIFGIIFAYLYKTRLESHYKKWKAERDEAEYAAKYHKNPDLLASRLEAQQIAAEKLQQKYKQDAEDYVKKLEEKEAKKREEIIARLEGQGGERLGSKADDSSKKLSNTDYFPLMGAGSSSNYRAPKKSKCGSGGCGR